MSDTKTDPKAEVYSVSHWNSDVKTVARFLSGMDAFGQRMSRGTDEAVVEDTRSGLSAWSRVLDGATANPGWSVVLGGIAYNARTIVRILSKAMESRSALLTALAK